ncbi:MAG: hypothetical protein SNJ63_03260, partial [Sphingomonadaceae bacterium]
MKQTRLFIVFLAFLGLVAGAVHAPAMAIPAAPAAGALAAGDPPQHDLHADCHGAPADAQDEA